MCVVRLSLAAFLSAAVVIAGGCGSSERPRYQLSGSVTYQGNPVPRGSIRIEPDSEKGNNGPGTSASIEDGKFKTPPSEGHVGGPHKIFISGFDGVPFDIGGGQKNPQGKPLFSEHKIELDLPKANGEQKFEVPGM